MHLPPLLRAARRFAVSRPEARRFAARAWLGAPVVRASLAVVGLRSTLRWIDAVTARTARSTRARHHGGVDRPDMVEVVEGAALVTGVFRVRWVRGVGGECLPRSLVQYLVHRLDGQPVRFVVGVRRPDSTSSVGEPVLHDEGSAPNPPARGLEAHAWVDAGDEVSGDPAFTPLYFAGAGAEA